MQKGKKLNLENTKGRKTRITSTITGERQPIPIPLYFVSFALSCFRDSHLNFDFANRIVRSREKRN